MKLMLELKESGKEQEINIVDIDKKEFELRDTQEILFTCKSEYQGISSFPTLIIKDIAATKTYNFEKIIDIYYNQ